MSGLSELNKAREAISDLAHMMHVPGHFAHNSECAHYPKPNDQEAFNRDMGSLFTLISSIEATAKRASDELNG